MGVETEIAWTQSTWNPVWGCTRVDPACLHCYAESFDKRVGGAHWGPHPEFRTFGAAHWAEPLKWQRDAAKAGVRRRVFCASMTDIFHAEMPKDVLPRFWDLVRRTPNLDWLILTKRHDRIRLSLPKDWGQGYPNGWLGVTVGDIPGLRRADELRDIPAVVRFLSVEPLLEDLGRVNLKGIDWVIVGGESGGKARPMDLAWARSLRDATKAAGSTFFFKQIGGPTGNKRDQMADFPKDLQIRDFPTPRIVPAHRAAGALF